MKDFIFQHFNASATRDDMIQVVKDFAYEKRCPVAISSDAGIATLKVRTESWLAQAFEERNPHWIIKPDQDPVGERAFRDIMAKRMSLHTSRLVAR